MLIVTAGSNNYAFEKTIRYNQRKAEEFGYGFVAHDLGGLGFGEKVVDVRTASKYRRVKSAMKPELILRTMTLRQSSDLVVWVDGDATLIRPIDELVDDESWDVGVTVRPKVNNKKTCYINAGVCFFRAKAWRFVSDWRDAIPTMPDIHGDTKPGPEYSDQTTLEEKILLPAIKEPLWDLVGQVRDVNGMRVKFFPCEVYNNYWCIKAPYYDNGPGNAKIIHFKGHRMHRIDDYHDRFLS